jgi:hypothetical protein
MEKPNRFVPVAICKRRESAGRMGQGPRASSPYFNLVGAPVAAAPPGARVDVTPDFP